MGRHSEVHRLSQQKAHKPVALPALPWPTQVYAA